MVLLRKGAVLEPREGFSGSFPRSSSRQRLHDKLDMLQNHLEHDDDLTRYQPSQVAVMESGDVCANMRVILLTTNNLCWRHQALTQTQSFGGPTTISSDMLRGTDFRVSERYRCVADHSGQAQGGVGFIYEGYDLVDNARVAVKFFHKIGTEPASTRINTELVTCLRLHPGLHSACMGGDDEQDLQHLTKLRDVVVNAPLYDDSGNGVIHLPGFSATAMIFDWADGGDAHTLMVNRGSLTPPEAAHIFRQTLRGLRALHRRGIVHRDIKPENILLNRESQTARLCDLGFAKHVPSVLPADLLNDPTCCYQSPERWLSCESPHATRARAAAAGGAGVARRDETPDSLFASDIFSAGVTLFMLVGYNAILTRTMTNTFCTDVEDGGGTTLPAMNIFQQAADGGVFALLRADVRVQHQLWNYWESYGLSLPPALRGLLDGVLHPVPENRFSLGQAFAWMDANPEIFVPIL